MPKMVVLSQAGKELHEITLADTVFGIEPNQQCIFDAIVMQRASMRQGTHDTKNRTEVRGGGRKPWRQKGTGRARHPCYTVERWRNGIRSYTKKLCIQAEQKSSSSGTEISII